ncbi:MAG: hypothetical protein JHD16_05065 [Solirubrobacteraceae bacterium]|nr:hypothetical protein [Solirubrobacteraceae bacterium]
MESRHVTPSAARQVFMRTNASRPTRRTRAAVAVALSAAACCASGAAPAQAGSFEQISRISGAQGWAPFLAQNEAIFTSDTGRWAILRSRAWDGPQNIGAYYVRDIVSNTTRPLGDSTVAGFYGLDKAEQNALVIRYAAGGATTLALVPLAGGAPKVIFSSPTTMPISAALSGDGKTVAASPNDGSGLYKISTATKAITKIDTTGVELGPRSISDDGQVIAGSPLPNATFNGVYYRGTTKTTTPGRAIVSPDGSVVAAVAYDGTAWKVITQRLATGAVKSFALPTESYDLQWISPDGRYVASSANQDSEPAVPTKVLDTVTGTWSTLGGPYAFELQASLTGLYFNPGEPAPAISRSGRYASERYSGFAGSHLALFDLAGADLPGDQERLSASSFVNVTPPIITCGGETVSRNVTGLFSQPRAWMPRPKRATLRITADGVELLNKTLTDPGVPTQSDGDFGTVDFPLDAKLISYSASVVYADGSVVTGTDSAKPRNFCQQ